MAVEAAGTKLSRFKSNQKEKNWTHWELNPTPLAQWMLSERDNQLHHVPFYRVSHSSFLDALHSKLSNFFFNFCSKYTNFFVSITSP